MALISDLSISGVEVADQIGIHPVTVARIRREIKGQFFRLSDWFEGEIDFIIENMNRMSTAKMAAFLGREVNAVQVEIDRLRTNGVVAKRTTQRLDPWVIGDRLLLAKTCPDCGLFLESKWFPLKQRKNRRGSYWHNCKKCRVEAKRSAGEDSHTKWKRTARRYHDRLQAETAERAENHGKEWTSADMETLSNPELTHFQKALRLGRTLDAVSSAVQKNGFSSRRQPLPDPASSEWLLFWEFEIEDLEGVAA